MAVQEALQAAPFSLRQFAEDAGVKYATIRAYAIGRRAPGPETVEQLAAGLRRRAERLQELAKQLERIADE